MCVHEYAFVRVRMRVNVCMLVLCFFACSAMCVCMYDYHISIHNFLSSRYLYLFQEFIPDFLEEHKLPAELNEKVKDAIKAAFAARRAHEKEVTFANKTSL